VRIGPVSITIPHWYKNITRIEIESLFQKTTRPATSRHTDHPPPSQQASGPVPKRCVMPKARPFAASVSCLLAQKLCGLHACLRTAVLSRDLCIG